MRTLTLATVLVLASSSSALAGSFRSSVDNTIRNERGHGSTVTKTKVYETSTFEGRMDVEGVTKQIKLEAIAPNASAFLRFNGGHVWGGANTSTTPQEPVDPIILIQSRDSYEGHTVETRNTSVEQFSLNKEKYGFNESFIEAGSTFSF